MDSELKDSEKISKEKIRFLRIKRKILKHVWLVRGLIIAGILVLGIALFLLLGIFVKRVTSFDSFSVLKNFIFASEENIKSFERRTNILILGKGGAGHDAPDLTDTVIFMSISHNQDPIVLVSLPRDIWIPELRAKLNSIYYWGNQKKPGGGLPLTKSVVEQILGKQVHYGLVIDFSVFKRVIDILDGIEVGVETGFVDEMYPIPGRENDECQGDPEYKCRYETIEFAQGLQTMDGETALKFVRSRNAEGDEGTDLARSARQEKVIAAIKEKALSRQVLFSPTKTRLLIDVALESVETDIEGDEAAILARRVLQNRDEAGSYILNDDLLVNPPKSMKYDNLYVFVPADGDWKEVHTWVSKITGQ